MKFLLSLLIFSTVALAGDAPPATAPSNTRYASRDLTIQWSLPVSDATIVEFINRSSAEIGSRVLGVSAEKSPELLDFNLSRGVNASVLHLQVTVPADARPAAKECVDQLTAALQKWAVAQFNDQREQQLRPVAQERDEATMQLSHAADQMRNARAMIQKLAGRADVTPATITAALTNLEDEKQKLELDLMAKHARADALEKQVADQSERITKLADSDAIVAELQKVVEAREMKVKTTQAAFKAAAASQGDVNDAVAAAAEARAKLLQRKRDAVAEAGGAVLEGFNRELITLSVDLRELEARLKFVESHLPGLRDAMERLDVLQRAEQELRQAQNELEKADTRLRDRARAVNSARSPSIFITRRENLPEPPPSSFGEGRGPGAR